MKRITRIFFWGGALLCMFAHGYEVAFSILLLFIAFEVSDIRDHLEDDK